MTIKTVRPAAVAEPLLRPPPASRRDVRPQHRSDAEPLRLGNDGPAEADPRPTTPEHAARTTAGVPVTTRQIGTSERTPLSDVALAFRGVKPAPHRAFRRWTAARLWGTFASPCAG